MRIWPLKRREIDVPRHESLAMWNEAEPVTIIDVPLEMTSASIKFDVWTEAIFGATASGASDLPLAGPEDGDLVWEPLDEKERRRLWQPPVEPATM